MTYVEQPDLVAFAMRVLADNATGTPIENVAVRGGRSEPGDEPPFVLLDEAGFIRERGIGMYSPFRLAVTVYGRSEREASGLYRGVTGILHGLGPLTEDGVGVFGIFDETGPSPISDPDTRWPGRFGVLAIYGADRLLSIPS